MRLQILKMTSIQNTKSKNTDRQKQFDNFEEDKMSIAFNCHHCNNDVVSESNDHNHSICVEKDGDELWFCSYCYGEDHHIQYIPEEEDTSDEEEHVLVKCDFCGIEEDSDEMIKGVKGVGCPDCRHKCDEVEEEESDEEECGKCGSCGVELEDLRDGTEEDGHRCHNCYWEEEGPRMREKDRAELIYPDYRNKEKEVEELQKEYSKYFMESCCADHHIQYVNKLEEDNKYLKEKLEKTMEVWKFYWSGGLLGEDHTEDLRPDSWEEELEKAQESDEE